jgi:hypothetical protein
MKKNVVPATKPENTGNLVTSPLNASHFHCEYMRIQLGQEKDIPNATMPQSASESGRVHTQLSSLSAPNSFPPIPPPKIDLRYHQACPSHKVVYQGHLEF